MNVTGPLIAFVFVSDHRRILGVRRSTVFVALPVLLGLSIALPTGTGTPLAIGLGATLALGAIWSAVRRRGYTRFVGEPGARPREEAGDLKVEEQVALRATGRFSLHRREDDLLLLSATLWRVAVGDHVIMVAAGNGRYRYEFITRGSLVAVRAGRLLFGARPPTTLAVTFRSSWGPAFAAAENVYTVGRAEPPTPVEKTVYLSFVDEDERDRVWLSLLR